jgi:hypothetical protein
MTRGRQIGRPISHHHLQRETSGSLPDQEAIGDLRLIDLVAGAVDSISKLGPLGFNWSSNPTQRLAVSR